MGKKHTSNKVIVETILATGMSHKDAAALFNVSTRWIRELIHRYRKGGYQALEPRSRRPHSNPRQVPESTVKAILDIRQHLENTGQDNGAHTIRWHLRTWPPLGRHLISSPVGLGRKVIYHHA